MSNSKLLTAKELKNDEFYTEYQTISNEIAHYRSQLKGKTVYCNCDDPSWSNFWRYFHNNFTSLGLKKLVSTHYQKNSEPSYMIEYEGGDDFDIDCGNITEIYGDKFVDNDNSFDYFAGDFRSNKCLELLDKADVVVTNPPFSLFSEYLKCLIEHNKKFIIIGNQVATQNKEIFPLIKNNLIWYGASIHSGGVDFRLPDDLGEYGKNVFIRDGHHYINKDGIRWFTNMDVKYRHDGLWHLNGIFDQTQAHVYYEGREDKYLKYFNYDGIDVNSVSEIPIDFEGIMGVPINFLDKFNPDEFEIVGNGSDVQKKFLHKVVEPKKTIAYVTKKGEIVWSTPYTVKERKLGNGLRTVDSSGDPGGSPFSRILIRNLHPIKKSDDLGY